MAQTRVRKNREESRRRILDAVAELVRERSYTALTVDEVMSRAGIGRTIFYRHFDDLGELLMRAGREAISAGMWGASPRRSPMTRTWTLLAWRSARSLRMKRRSRPRRSDTSSAG